MKTSTSVAVAAASLLALGGAFTLGTQVASDPDGSPRSPGGHGDAAGEPLGAGDLSLVAAGSCDDLLGWYVDNTRDLVGPWGWEGGMADYYATGPMERGRRLGGLDVDGPQNLAPSAAVAEELDSAGKSLDNAQTSSATGTNVQEVGVDEPDVVKADGELLVRLDGDDLTAYDLTGKAPRRVSRFDLPVARQSVSEFLLVGDRAVVISQESHRDGVTTRVLTVSFADPADPELVDDTRYDAQLLSARQYGATVRLVLGTGLPQLDFVTPAGKVTERDALEQNRKVLEASTIGDWLPTLLPYVPTGTPKRQQVVDCADMSRPEDFAGAGSVSIVGFSADAPTTRSSTGVAAVASTVYSSTERLYLATTAGWGGPVVMSRPACPPNADCMLPEIWPAPDQGGSTQLHAFTLDGTGAAYRASGEVEGTVRDRWAMDEVDGVLRVAVGPSSETGNHNAIVTMKERDGALVELGRADRLGVNEEIMSVRWLEDVAILVTFRRIDPLYAVDLSDPAHPEAVGKLKVPGYSDYLHPIGDRRVLGVGVSGGGGGWRGAGPGGQVSLFDLTDLEHPTREAVETYPPGIRLHAGDDPRSFTWVPSERKALVVFSRTGRSGGATGYVSILTVGADGSLSRRTARASDGVEDTAKLRTLPLPDGRVAIVSEYSVRFMHL